jgi:hypothetical protein
MSGGQNRGAGNDARAGCAGDPSAGLMIQERIHPAFQTDPLPLLRFDDLAARIAPSHARPSDTNICAIEKRGPPAAERRRDGRAGETDQRPVWVKSAGSGHVRRPSGLPSIAGILLRCCELAVWGNKRHARDTMDRSSRYSLIERAFPHDLRRSGEVSS